MAIKCFGNLYPLWIQTASSPVQVEVKVIHSIQPFLITNYWFIAWLKFCFKIWGWKFLKACHQNRVVYPFCKRRKFHLLYWKSQILLYGQCYQLLMMSHTFQELPISGFGIQARINILNPTEPEHLVYPNSHHTQCPIFCCNTLPHVHCMGWGHSPASLKQIYCWTFWRNFKSTIHSFAKLNILVDWFSWQFSVIPQFGTTYH